MLTFLPLKSFVKSLECLDEKRLSRQRVDSYQILEVLYDYPVIPNSLRTIVPFDRKFGGWQRHPSIIMWRGHEEWLKLYIACVIGEWCSRGLYNSIANYELPAYNTNLQGPPPWLGYEPFHRSHRELLVWKNPVHYLKLWPEDKVDFPKLFWPS